MAKGGAGGLVGAEAAKEGLRRRQEAKKTGPGPKPTATGKSQQTMGFNFFTEEAPGLKVSPKTVLITSLVYIGVVVLLHIWSKVRGDTPQNPTAA